MTLGTDSRLHRMSPTAGCRPPSGQLRAAAFQSSRPGHATNVWTSHSTMCLKATLCFLDNGCRPKHTHSSFYDYKVSILFMVPSLFPHSQLCCVLLVPHPRCSALCLLASTPPPHPVCFNASLPLSLLPCFSAMSPSQWFSPPFRPLVRFSLITKTSSPSVFLFAWHSLLPPACAVSRL